MPAKLPLRYQHHQAWISATELLIAAADLGGSIEIATDQIEGALFLTHMLVLEATKPRPLGIYAERPLGTNCRILRFPFITWRCNEKEVRFVPCC
jgi:hypothetical protein